MQVVEADAPAVELLAVRPSWVRVQSADGTVLFEKVLDAGERYVVPQMEAPAVLRFARNTPFPPHADYLDPGDLDLRDQLIAEGQRLVTFLLFLNDDYEGGETDFPNIPRQLKGKKGDALFWWNLDPDGGLEPAAHNGNLAVTQGEKFVLSQWIRIPALQRGA